MPAVIKIKSVRLDAPSFTNSFKKLPDNIKAEGIASIKSMINEENIPAKIHFHKMQGYDIYCIHISRCDTYKATFTIEGSIGVFRKAGKHDRVDRNP